jgi:CheY-like chemotaxis protein
MEMAVYKSLFNSNSLTKLEDPIAALENYRPDSYDLLILDIKMPKMHGFELYRQMKR